MFRSRWLMSDFDDNRARRGARAPLLSLAAAAQQPNTAPEPAKPGREEGAAGRHRHARMEREKTRATNPLLAELARADEEDAIDALDSDVEEFVSAAREERPAPRRAAAVSGQDEIFKPLIDPVLVATTVWNWRLPIAGLTVAGLFLGVAVALSTPHRYTAYSQLLVDPREVKLVGNDITPDYLANEAALAIVDSQLELVYSQAVLAKVVERAGLDRDPEFNGEGGAIGGVLETLKGFVSLFSGSDGVEEREGTAIRTLREDLWVERSARTFVINVGVTTLNAEKSALIANEVTNAFIEEQEKLKSETARSASVALTGRLETLRGDVENAEQALADYRAQNGLVGPAGRLLTDDQLSAVTGQLAEAKAATIAAKTRAEIARSVDVDAVVAGGLPQDLLTSALTSLRTQHASQRQQVAALENALGPRHPKLADAKASLQSLQSEIAAELRRIVSGTQADLRRAVRNEQELAASLAQLKAASVTEGSAAVGLRELEREATAARQVYEAFLLRARETGEIEALATANINIISPAETPDSPSSLSRKLIVAGYGAVGFALGMAFALLAALRENFFPARRDGDDPEPGGPRRRVFSERNDAPAAPRSPVVARHEAAVAAVRMAEEAENADQPETPDAGPSESEADMYPHPPHYPWPAPQDAAMQPAAPQAMAPQGWPQWPAAPMPPVAAWPAPPAYGWPQQPVYGYPVMPAPHWAQPQPPPQRAEPPVRNAADDGEIEDLRRSVREIRDTVEALIRRRGDRNRRVA